MWTAIAVTYWSYRCCLAGCRRQGVLLFVFLILALPLPNILSSFFIAFEFSFSEFLSYLRFCRAFSSTCGIAHSLSDAVRQTLACLCWKSAVFVLYCCLFAVCLRLSSLAVILPPLFSGRLGIILLLEWLSCMLHTKQQFLEYCLLSRTTVCVYT